MAEPPIVGIIGTQQAVRRYRDILKDGVVKSINGKRGAVSLNAGDINAVPAPRPTGLRSILNNSWATATLRASSWSAIEWSPELEIFVAVAYFGTEPRAVFSGDGETWIDATIPPGLDLRHVIWVPEKGSFVAVGHNGVVASSRDGQRWDNVSIGQTDISSIAYSPELDLFVLVTAGPTERLTTRILISQTLLHYEPIDIEYDNLVFSDVEWIRELGLFVATTSTFTHPTIWTSPDGRNWRNPEATPLANGLAAVAWSRRLGRLCAVEHSPAAAARAAISEDGQTWTLHSMGEAVGFRDVVWCNGPDVFLALSAPGQSVGAGVTAGKIMMSQDGGLTWAPITAGTPIHDYQGIVWCYELGQCFGVGDSGTAAERVLKSRSVFHL